MSYVLAKDSSPCYLTAMRPADPRAIRAWQQHKPNFFGTHTDKHIRALAKHLGITQGAVSKWKQVPDYRLEETAAFLGLHPSDLRPDIDPFEALNPKGK